MKYLFCPIIFFFIITIESALFAFAQLKQKGIEDKKMISATRAENGKIHIDGKLDDPVWQIAFPDTHFTQFEPDEGEPASLKTTIRVAYDDHALYVAMQAYEPDIQQISYQLTRRDEQAPSDWLGVIVDSYDDKRTAFAFAAYVSGVKYDAYLSDDTNTDSNWDAVWEVKTFIDIDGWNAEFRIPFSQLRFPNKKVQSWGFQAVRFRNKNNELDQWQYIPKDAAGFVSQFGKLIGIKNIPQPRHLQILPYFVFTGNYLPSEEGNPFRSGSDYDFRLGGDIKYGLTSNITFDITFNPDFGQVEADPSEVNLTAYETFFEEKRPFFLEGNSIFNYRIGIGDGPFGSETMFYSRRIGRRPHREPDVPDDDYYKIPQWTNILGAAKISGKTAKGWSIGILEALTGEMKAEIQQDNMRYKEIVEPWTNYFLARTQKDFRQGRTTLGAIVTNVTRDVPSPELYELNRTAFSSGIDFTHKWNNDNYMIEARILGSYIQGHKQAIQEAQKSSARYFQRPDVKHVHYDSNRTSLSGYGAKLVLSKIAGGHWRYGLGGVARSPGLEINDMGYLREADISVGFIYLGYVEYKPGTLFRTYHIFSNVYGGIDYNGTSLFKGVNINCDFEFLNYWDVWFGFVRNSEQLETGLLRGGPAVILPPSSRIWFGFSSDERKKLSGRIRGFYSTDDLGFNEFGLSPSFTIRPSGQIDMTFMFGYNSGIDDHQYVDEEELLVNGTIQTHYILSRIKTKNTYLITRLNYTFTPNLTVQYYSMPFIFSGTYSNYREVVNPRANNYYDRFQPYAWSGNDDFNFKEFRSNLVLRWEYRPGSTIFLVWSHDRSQTTEGEGSFDLIRDITRLFRAESENVFLVKINRWFDF